MMKAIPKKIIGLSLYALYSGLNVIFFEKKKRIIFISFPEASDNSWYLYCYALTYLKDYELIWLVDQDSSAVKNKILKQYHSIPNSNKVIIAKRWSIKSLALFAGAKFVFHTHGTYYFIKKSFNAPIIVNLWHGMPIKAIGHLDKDIEKNFCYSNFSIATSEYYRKIISKAFDLPIENVLKTGLPRNDVLYTGISDNLKNKILHSLNIIKEEKIIVWLPTYRVSKIGDIRKDGNKDSFLSDLEKSFLVELEELCQENDIKIVVKLHPMDSALSEVKTLSFSNINFFDSKSWESLNINLYDLISISHGVISDFSSVMIDCLPTKIPVGFIENSKSTYTRKTLFPISDFVDLLYSINAPKDIINMVEISNIHTPLNTGINKYGNIEKEASKKLFETFNIR